MDTRNVIGLTRGTVLVVAHREAWRELFEEERDNLQERIGHLVLDIQHVGSTAVPGLDAKPIIDVAVAVAAQGVIPRLRRPLWELGYIDRGDAGDDGGYLFVRESAPNVRTHHLHVVTVDDPQWCSYLLFRDMLASDEALRTNYARLKRALQEQFAQDRRAYTKAKNEFVQAALSGRRPA